jgi:hypothetical protein
VRQNLIQFIVRHTTRNFCRKAAKPNSHTAGFPHYDCRDEDELCEKQAEKRHPPHHVMSVRRPLAAKKELFLATVKVDPRGESLNYFPTHIASEAWSCSG